MFLCLRTKLKKSFQDSISSFTRALSLVVVSVKAFTSYLSTKKLLSNQKLSHRLSRSSLKNCVPNNPPPTPLLARLQGKYASTVFYRIVTSSSDAVG